MMSHRCIAKLYFFYLLFFFLNRTKALQNGTKPSINQLQQQQHQQQSSTNMYPSLFNNNNSLFMNNTAPTGQLAQPLIVPPRPGLEMANGGVLMPTMNPTMSTNTNNTSNFLPSNTNTSSSSNSTNPFLAM